MYSSRRSSRVPMHRPAHARPAGSPTAARRSRRPVPSTSGQGWRPRAGRQLVRGGNSTDPPAHSCRHLPGAGLTRWRHYVSDQSLGERGHDGGPHGVRPELRRHKRHGACPVPRRHLPRAQRPKDDGRADNITPIDRRYGEGSAINVVRPSAVDALLYLHGVSPSYTLGYYPPVSRRVCPDLSHRREGSLSSPPVMTPCYTLPDR